MTVARALPLTRATLLHRTMLAVGAWMAAQGIASVMLIEHVVPVTTADAASASIARWIAYVGSAASLLASIGVAFAFAVLVTVLLRWLEAEVDLRLVLASVEGGLWVLVARDVVAAVALPLFDSTTFHAAVTSAGSGFASLLALPEPWRSYQLSKLLALVLALFAVSVALRHRTRCQWGDVLLSVALSASVLTAILTGMAALLDVGMDAPDPGS